MAEQNAEQEPTMEEILASIRRIISEDDDAPASEAEEEADVEAVDESVEEDVIELTEVVEDEPEAAVKPEPVPEPEPVPAEEEILVLDDEPAEAVVAAVETNVEEDLVSEPVANAAASAFGDLVGQMLVSSRSTEGKTLEDIVRELIKPMLRDWLDANLRQIVENKVADEVEKISARARH